jgi:WW domain-containing oxidoreductase
MQVNVFAQAHIMLTLLPVLRKTTDSRIVSQSSDLHRAAPASIKFESIDEINTDIGATFLYSRTKLAQILFSSELLKRIKVGQFGEVTEAEGLPWINSTHPGGIKTDQQFQAEEAYGTISKIGVRLARPLLGDPVDKGCRPALFAVASPDIATEQIQGAYIVPDRKPTDPSSQAKDEDLSASLWKLTKEILESKIANLNYTM